MAVSVSDVNAVAKRVVAKGKGKAKEVSDTPVPDIALAVPPVTVAVKKEPTEKQLAARAKAAETRRLKKENAAKELEVEKELEVQKALLAEKEAAKEKRKLAKQAKEMVAGVSEALGEEPKVKKVKVDDDKPPAWFNQYMIKEAQKATPEVKFEKEQKDEVKVIAAQKWGEPKVRKGVVKEMNNHEARLFKMMFG